MILPFCIFYFAQLHSFYACCFMYLTYLWGLLSQLLFPFLLDCLQTFSSPSIAYGLINPCTSCLSISIQSVAYPSWPCSYLTFCGVLTAFHDHSFGYITFSKTLLLTVWHFSPKVSSIVLLDVSIILPLVVVKHFHLCACCIVVQYPIMLNWTHIHNYVF